MSQSGSGWIVAGLSVLFASCAPKPTPAPVAATAPPPLERICQDAFPIPERTVGALVSHLKRIEPAATVEVRPCHAATSWPIAYATGEAGKAPVGFAVLEMTGDALLIFDAADREAPSVQLCNEIEVRLGDRQRVRAIALWESTGGDEKGIDPAQAEASKAGLAFVELYSRAPSLCALGKREAAGEAGDEELEPKRKLGDEKRRCSELPLVLLDRAGCDPAPVPDGGAPPAPAAPAPAQAKTPSAEEVDRAVAGNHRYTGEGRAAGSIAELKLEGRERCLYEPPPAARDVCLATYTDGTGARWYGRSDVTRTGENGQKNYVDSYLTFQLLKRIEAERKKSAAPATKN